MKLFFLYLKQRKKWLTVFFAFFSIFLVAFLLYHLPLGAVLYPTILCVLISLVFIVNDFFQEKKKIEKLQQIEALADILTGALPPSENVLEESYQRIIHLLGQEQKSLKNKMDSRYEEMIDYYTLWAHQIKTPIAAMRLNLQNEDSVLSRKLSADLFRIEQYVEMVLVFLRLDSESSDYVIREYDLDFLVRQAVKRFAGEFINRRIKMDYQSFQAKVITDEKWLTFVIEQVLSNALKYTSEGSVQISLREPKTLCIRDTGIGIAPEDLPRIFEKGYTGYNGRSDKRASGIGLYLCKRICGNLGHAIWVESVPDRGTVIKIDLNQRKMKME